MKLSTFYDTIVIHHTQRSQNENIKSFQKDEFKKYADFSYHYIISGDGTIYEGREISYKGAHVEGANTGKIGVALMGNFSSEENIVQNVKDWVQGASCTDPTEEQLESLEYLLLYLDGVYGTPTICGHKDAALKSNPTNCPGNRLYEKLLEMNLLRG